MEKVAQGVYYRSFGGLNVGLVVGREGLVMVDAPPFPSWAHSFQEGLAGLGRMGYIVLTDHHPRRALGSAFFGGEVVGHRLTRERMLLSEKGLGELEDFLAAGDPEDATSLVDFHPRPPTIVFSESLTLHRDDGPLELLYTPGHTPSSIAAYLPRQGIAFTGDTLVNGVHPSLMEANLPDWLRSLERLEGLEAELYIPGHGEPCGKLAIGVLKGYLAEVLGAVRTALERGLSRAEAVDGLDLLDSLPTWGERSPELERRYRAGIGRVYDELMLAREEGR